jgi:uncharacterized protein YbgA (DUF1722 family)
MTRSKSHERDALDLYDEVDKLFDIAFPPPNAQYAPGSGEAEPRDGLLVSFIDACLTNLGWSREVLAELMATDVQLIDAILDGTLPESAIDDDLLADLGHAIGYDPGLLKMLVKYTKTPQADLEILVEKLIDFAVDGSVALETVEAFAAQVKEIEALHEDLANLLLHVFGGYYSAQVAGDRRQRILYQAVIKKIKAVIGSYQTDLEEAQAHIRHMRDNYQGEIKSIQAMLNELRAHQVFESLFDRDQLDLDMLRAAIREKIDSL